MEHLNFEKIGMEDLNFLEFWVEKTRNYIHFFKKRSIYSKTEESFGERKSSKDFASYWRQSESAKQ